VVVATQIKVVKRDGGMNLFVPDVEKETKQSLRIGLNVLVDKGKIT